MARATVKKPSAVKMCLRCQKVKPLTDFYSNKSWADQNGRDLYCKDCAREMCVDRDTMRQYMWENNRLWLDAIWESAEKRAMRVLANNAEYLSEKTSKKKKEEVKNRAICNQAFFTMNLANFYAYHDNSDEEGNIRDFNPDSMDGSLIQTDSGDQVANEGAKIYSAVWNGMFTQREIQYLDEYYDRLDSEFVLDDVNIQDYARKVAKASLEADTRYNNMRIGKCTSKEWKEAQDMFDGLSKSANFAACQKKDRGSVSNEVLCEIIQNIEIHHRAEMPQVFFPPDDIDRIIADFAHTDDAIK